MSHKRKKVKVKSHLAVGTLFGVGVLGVHNFKLTHLQVLMLAAIVVGSIIPDIDLTLSGFKYEKFKDRTFLSHRGITHHVLLPVITALIGFIFSKPILVAFAIGLAIHIVMDMFSPLGVPYGLKYQKRLRIPLYTTGNVSEKIFLAFVLLLVFAVFFGKNFN